MFSCRFPAIALLCVLAISAAATTHRTSAYPTAQEAVDKCQPGDAVVFDADGAASIAVSRELSDVQFIGGKGTWKVDADIEDCAFYHHGFTLESQTARIRRTAFYKCSPRGTFTHLDSVSLYYAGGYLWPRHNPDNGATPQLRIEGFVRGVLIHKAISGLNGQERRFDMDWAPACRIFAHDPVGNGMGTYVLSPIIWDQRAWTPYHIVRGTGITVAHANTEYNIWADPIAQFDNGTDCMLLCNGVGSRSDANNYHRQPDVLQYHDHVELGHDVGHAPFRGAAFDIAGQRNRNVAMGSYKTWTIGAKPYLACFHYGDGVSAADPLYTEWATQRGPANINFAEPKAIFVFDRKKGNHVLMGDSRYPIDGPNIIAPVFVQLDDIRYDFTYKPTGEQLQDTLRTGNDKGPTIHLAPGTYQMTQTLTKGKIVGSGAKKTILVWNSSAIDCARRPFRGFVNCTVKGGRYGMNDQEGSGGYGPSANFEVLRTCFKDQAKAGITVHATQNQVYQDLTFDGCEVGFAVCLISGASCGEHLSGGLNLDKLDITNCTFRNIGGTALKLNGNVNKNGQVAVHNCTFENIGGSAIEITNGQTHLVQNITVKDACTAQDSGIVINIRSAGWDGAVAASHITIDNSGVSPKARTGIVLGGIGAVSHCTITGVATAVEAPAEKATVDHVDAPDGSLAGGAYVARSRFSNVTVGVDGDEHIALNRGGSYEAKSASRKKLDTTPPPEVDAATVRVEKKQNDAAFPYYETYNLVAWEPVEDKESGIRCYAVLVDGKEIGRTPAYRRTYRPSYGDIASFTVAPTFFRDPDVSHQNYTVKPINGAHLFPDGSIAPERRWMPIRGRFMTANDSLEFRVHTVDYGNRTVTDTVRNATLPFDSFINFRSAYETTAGSFPTHYVKNAGPYSMGEGYKLSTFRAAAGPRLKRPVLTATHFSVDRPMRLEVHLLDISGRRVATLWKGNAHPGVHRFRPSRVATGTYVVHLSAKDIDMVRAVRVMR